MRKHMTLIVLALMLVATAGVVAYDSVDEVITFPDSNLEALIRYGIQKPTGDIRQSDLVELTGLWDPWITGGREIHNLYGLENCVNLEYLLLGSNNIHDISPLAGLTKLTAIHLERNEITDISPLARLTSLERLAVNANRISDLEPLANLTSLTVLV